MWCSRCLLSEGGVGGPCPWHPPLLTKTGTVREAEAQPGPRLASPARPGLGRGHLPGIPESLGELAGRARPPLPTVGTEVLNKPSPVCC